MLHKQKHNANHKQPNTLKKWLVVFFAFLLLVVNTPMDFIHSFIGHKDEIHLRHNGLVIEKHHHHCSFLSLSVTPFANDTHFPVVRFLSPDFFVSHAVITATHHQCALFSSSPRGPPVA